VLIDAHSKLLMIGDSITDAERFAELRFLPSGGLGHGYVSYVAALLSAVHPEHGIQVINRGVSGNTVRDLKLRWQEDVLNMNPDWVSIMIGINDVWQQFDTPDNPAEHVYIEEYRQTLEELLGQTTKKVKGIVLLTPYYIEPNHKDPMRIEMDRYGKEVRTLSEKFNTVFIDIQANFDEALNTYSPTYLAEDKIHPSPVGHMIIAYAFLKAVGFAW
jgi:lysophospholipase L1-like esterase